MPLTKADPQMELALAMAQKAMEEDELPIGAALFHKKTGECVAKSYNKTKALNNPTAHAEMNVIIEACAALETTYLNDYVLFTTLEPCAMCATAASFAKVGEIRFGAYDVKSGGTVNGARIFDQKTCHHKPEVYGGIMEGICGELLREFFQKKRGLGSF